MAVVGVTGHRKLSPPVAEYVATELRRLLHRHPAAELIGLTCLAEGADTIFADVVLALGGRLVVFVPARGYRDFLPPEHRPDFDRLCSAAWEVRRLPHTEADLPALMDASRHLVDAADEIIAVWDGNPARGYAGTADVVDYAVGRDTPVYIVWPEGTKRP